jgi:class 3 adenylate cyclase
MTPLSGKNSTSIEEVRRLKQEGLSMAQIIDRLGGAEIVRKHQSAAQGAALHLTLDDIEHPAYMINQNFELVWINDAAKQALFGGHLDLPQTSEARNLFRLLPVARGEWGSLLSFHVGIAKSTLSTDGFSNVCRGLDPVTYARLQAAYIDAPPAPAQPIIHSEVRIPGAGGEEKYFQAFASFFREGTFVAMAAASGPADAMLDLLARRDEVIRDLLRKRLPVLTDVAVLVSDLQGSVKICSELPPEEYFELINEIWRTLAPVFRKYRGTCGKHVGDGLVYYFFPQPDSHYLANAVACALEIRQVIQHLSKAWQLRKQWFNELYLNTGINEGQEWLGTFQTPTSIEFVVLGDTINQAARVSDFARHGGIWVTKGLVGKLPAEERARLSYGVRRRSPDGREVFVASSFSQVSALLDQDGMRLEKLRDIATLPITEIIELRPPAA